MGYYLCCFSPAAMHIYNFQTRPCFVTQINAIFFFWCIGLLKQPKWGHLKDLHRAIKLCEPALVSGDPTVTHLGNYQEVGLFLALLFRFHLCIESKHPQNSIFQIVQAHVFKSRSGACAAFLANYNQHSYATVSFGNKHYNLPPWSISILPDCKNTVYNTARVRIRLFFFCSSDI